VRTCAVIALLLPVLADADPTIRAHHVTEEEPGPLLHLDTVLLDESAGGVADGRQAVLDIGPRARLAAEGKWWVTGLAPSIFAEDLDMNGWRASAELSYDLGPFSVGLNGSMGKTGDLSHRMVGLFAFRKFRLSKWMHAWIVLGVSFEQWNQPGAPARSGTNVGLSIGTTFR
jgi:hypothetical protein